MYIIKSKKTLKEKIEKEVTAKNYESIADLKDDIKFLKKMKADQDNTANDVASIKSELRSLNSVLARVVDAIDNLEKEVSKNEECIGKLEKEVDAVEDRLSDAEEDINSAESEIESIEEQVEEEIRGGFWYHLTRLLFGCFWCF